MTLMITSFNRIFRNDMVAFVNVLSVLIFFSSCGTSQKLSNENLSSQFLNADEMLSPEVVVHHFSDDSSRVYFKIPSGKLLFISNGDKYLARLQVKYVFYSDYNSVQPIDTGMKLYEVVSSQNNVGLESFFDTKIISGSNIVLKITFNDVQRNAEAARYLNIRKPEGMSSQDFLIRNSDKVPLYRNFFSAPCELNVASGRYLTDSLWVRCYFRDFPIAVLPFRVIEDPIFAMASDSSFRISSEKLMSFKISEPGIYFLQNDTSAFHGLALLGFERGYPKVTHSDEMIEATRYLTTRREYQQLIQSADKKAALDQFWLDVGGNYERARNLIRAYYNRVQDANHLFTSYTDGWKTDRGMIHMVFGKPQSVYRDGETEQWSYTNVPGFPDILFVFRKMNNPFTDNDYALIRQSVYENVWYIAVDQWRQGRIVNDD